MPGETNIQGNKPSCLSMTQDALCRFKLEKLPTISQSLIDILHISQDTDQDMAKLASALQKDPVITARIFDVVSTIHYRPWKNVSDLHRLLVVLGLDSVRRIVFTCAVEQVFSSCTDLTSAQLQIVWYRSLLCAQQAEELARLISFPHPYEAYLAGLLHRIGQLVLMQNNPHAYVQSIDVTADYERVEEMEREMFGISSLEIGAELVATWQLPSFHADALRFQTLPAADVLEATDLVRILNFCQKLSCSRVDGVHAHAHTGNCMFGLTEGMLVQVYTTAYNKTSKIIEDITGAGDANHHLQALYDSHAPSDEALNTEVKQQTLLNNLKVGSQSADTLAAYCQCARQDLSFLFGLHEFCFLFADPDKKSLYGYDDTGQCPQLAQFRVGLEPGNSPLARALNNTTISYGPESTRAEKSLPEGQLARIMHKDELCYLPLRDGQEPVGICVIGLRPGQRKDIQTQESFLRLVADQIAPGLKDAISTGPASNRCPLSLDELDFHLRSVVHEVNNPLSIINTYLHILASQVGDTDQSFQHIQIIQDEIQRVSSMVAGLRQVAAPEQQDMQKTDINKLVERIHSFFQKSAFQGKAIESHLNLDPDVPSVQTQPDKVKQIVINLLKNAVEALQNNGEIYIRTRDKIFSQGKTYIELEIEDNGPGIEQEVLASLFQPDTSCEKSHSGLGLTIVNNLVDDLGGNLCCASGKWGTRFQIRLPRAVSQDSQE